VFDNRSLSPSSHPSGHERDGLGTFVPSPVMDKRQRTPLLFLFFPPQTERAIDGLTRLPPHLPSLRFKDLRGGNFVPFFLSLCVEFMGRLPFSPFLSFAFPKNSFTTDPYFFPFGYPATSFAGFFSPLLHDAFLFFFFWVFPFFLSPPHIRETGMVTFCCPIKARCEILSFFSPSDEIRADTGCILWGRPSSSLFFPKTKLVAIRRVESTFFHPPCLAADAVTASFPLHSNLFVLERMTQRTRTPPFFPADIRGVNGPPLPFFFFFFFLHSAIED